MSAHETPAGDLSALEAAVRTSQELTQAVIDSLAAHVAVLNRDGAIIATNAAWARFARDNSDGPAPHIGVGANYLAICRRATGPSSEGAAEVGAGIQAVLSGAVRHFECEYPCHAPNTQRWFLLQATGLERGAGGAVLLHVDITERKLTEGKLLEAERLKVLARGLLTGQEDERRRLARELHDGLNQQIALLSTGLGALARQLPDPVNARLKQLQQRTIDLSDQVRRMSHQLHPAMLEHVGLGEALRSLCREFEQVHAIALRPAIADELGEVGPVQALCLYRVAQECLRNVVRHSEATEATLVLRRSAADLELAVTDNGVGFTPDQIPTASGLGLASIEERVKLVGGRLAIASEPGGGTTIEARIPLGR